MSEEPRQTFTTSDGREIKRPRRAKVPDRYQKLIDDPSLVEELDDEELFRGVLRNADGHIRGTKPKAIPWVLHDAAMRQATKRLERTLLESMPDILQNLIDIATGEIGGDTGIAMDVQAKAAMYLTDRIMGKPVDRQQVDVKVTARWEEALSSGSLVVDLDDSDIIDAELVEEPSPEPALPQTTRALVERPSAQPAVEKSGEAGANLQAPRSRPTTGVKLR